jgi:hypothetical protein
MGAEERAAPMRVRVPVDALPHGLHHGLDHEDYHVRTLGMASSSALARVEKSLAHYRIWVDAADNDDGEDDTKALYFGRGFHCALLEPACFARTYCVEPEWGDCRKTDNKLRRDSWRLEHANLNLVSRADYDSWVGMAEAVRAHPTIGRLLAAGEPEITLRWRDADTGLECKARADSYVERHATVLDVKTCMDARPHAFARSVAAYGYHRQEAFYRRGFKALGLELREFVFVAVEKTPPYGVRIYLLNAEALEAGERAVSRSMSALAGAMQNGQWPAYPIDIEELALPRWAA